MNKTLKAIAAMMLLMVFVAGCNKPDEPNNGGGDTPITPDIPVGAISGKFTINEEGDKVYFSQGNLQFQASTNTWRFAEHQWDYIGTQTPDLNGYVGGNVFGSDNNGISSTYDGWIDLFGWGTSGFHESMDSNNTNFYPHSFSAFNDIVDVTNNIYGYGPSMNMTNIDLIGTSANYDWGVYNAISNSDNAIGTWRTLTKAEWDYVFNTRSTNAGIRYAKATVKGAHGVIVLPDDWSDSYYSLSNINTSDISYNTNVITVSQWSVLEQYGAVFLPAAGLRYCARTDLAGYSGAYWSTTSYYNNDGAYSVRFQDTTFLATCVHMRFMGLSVRLVCPSE